MPETSSKKIPSEDLADFFMNKIQKIRDALDHQPTYKPTDIMAYCKMDSFEKMYGDDVERIIRKMQTKSCKSNALPTDLLRKLLKGNINVITRIMNMSLRNGFFFASNRKTSITRPFLKRLRLDLILSTYRPVSNLPFLLEVLEQFVLKQFNNHCRRFDVMPD